MQIKVINSYGTVEHYYKKAHESAAIHYAKHIKGKVIDTYTGEVIADYCRKLEHERLKDNAEIKRKHKHA